MILAIKRLLNLVTKSKLTGKLDHITVAHPYWEDERMCIREGTFTAMDDFYSNLTIEKKNPATGEFEMDKAATAVVIDMYDDPTRLNKYVVVFKPRVESKSTARWEIDFKPDMRFDIDGTVFEIGDEVHIVYEYTLSKYNGLRKYSFYSNELLDVTLKTGQHIVGYLDTRMMYRRATETIGVFDHSSLPFRMITGNSDTAMVICISLDEILKIEELNELYADSICKTSMPLQDTYRGGTDNESGNE